MCACATQLPQLLQQCLSHMQMSLQHASCPSCCCSLLCAAASYAGCHFCAHLTFKACRQQRRNKCQQPHKQKQKQKRNRAKGKAETDSSFLFLFLFLGGKITDNKSAKISMKTSCQHAQKKKKTKKAVKEKRVCCGKGQVATLDTSGRK